MLYRLIAVFVLFTSAEAFAAEKQVPLVKENTDSVWVTSKYTYALEARTGTDIQVGGWGDFYEGYLRFDLKDQPKDVKKVVLRLHVKERADKDKDEKLTGFEVREVTYTCPLAKPGEDPRPTWSAEIMSYAMRPSSSFFAKVDVKAGYIDVDITELYTRWVKGATANHGLHFVPLDNGNTRTVISGVGDKMRPQLIITTP